MVLAAIVLVIALIGIITAIFNKLVKLNQNVMESWSAIEAELKRRYDLIPNLVETVKGYAAHERETLEKVTAARTAATTLHAGPQSQAADENTLAAALRGLFIVSEKYPQLLASQQFQKLQQELAGTETNISQARRFYNANVREMNTAVQKFPHSIFAKVFGFKEAQYFEIDEAVRQAPAVQI